MKSKKIFLTLCIMVMISLYAGVIYANDSNVGYNIENITVTTDDTEVEILQSQDGGYLKITQIGQNSQNVKITTSTFEDKIQLSGKANKGTEIMIEVHQDGECKYNYSTSAGSTENFSQTLDLLEGNNQIYIYYTNDTEQVSNYVVIAIKKESTEDMEKLIAWVDVPSF